MEFLEIQKDSGIVQSQSSLAFISAGQNLESLIVPCLISVY